MSFIIKVISIILIIITIYVLGIFLDPKLFDEIGKNIGTLQFNEKIRNFKTGADGVSDTLLQVKDAGQVIDGARNAVNTANDAIKKTQDTIDQKIKQTQKVIDSGKKVIDSTKEFNENVGELTSLSGSSSSTGAQ